MTNLDHVPHHDISDEEKAADEAARHRAALPATANRPAVPPSTLNQHTSGASALEKPPRFAALQYPNFRLFWAGNFISVIGTMIHQTGQGWLIRDLSADPRTVTAVTACATLPILLLSLISGVVADRVDKRRALVIFNMIAGGLALLLGVLVWTHLVQVWQVMLIALASGTLVAFEIPMRQTFYVELVGKNALGNAISLNSSAFNVARVIGPMLGGALIQGVGIDGCFLVNGFSFVFVIIGLAMMKLQKFEHSHTPMRMLWIWRGIKYVKVHSSILGICILVSAVSFAAMSYASLLPIFAKDVFKREATVYALLFAFNGVGALGASGLLATQRTMRHKGKRLFLGALIFSISVFAFAFSPSVPIACGILIVTGAAQLTMLITANTLVQTLSPDHLRGRVFSIYSMMFLGAAPFGAIFQGLVANALGARVSVGIGATLAGIASIIIFLRYRGLWKEA